MYLPDTARLTVVSCTPTVSAISAMVIGFKCDAPWSRKSRCGEDLAGTRIQSGDLIGGLLYVLDSYRHAARDLGEPVPAEVFHVLGNNSVLDTVFFSLSPQLNQQTRAQIARANSRRIKCLD